MALFFDAAWFDTRLAEKNLDRGALAACAGLERSELHRLFIHERAPTAAELNAFAELLGADLVEISLRCGVANPDAAPVDDPSLRIESMESRLDEIDQWLDSLEAQNRKRA